MREACACSGDEVKAHQRVARMEREQNPGFGREAAPDFVSLHLGYKTKSAGEESRQRLDHRVRLLELRQMAGAGDHLDPRARNLFRELPRINRRDDAIALA